VSEVLYKGKFLSVIKDGIWEFVERVGTEGAAAGIVWIEDKLVVVRQHRIPIGCDVLEFPAGLIDAEESSMEAVVRELKEETGITLDTGGETNVGKPKTVESFSSPGLTSEKTILIEFPKKSVKGIGGQDLKDEEKIEVMLLPIAKIMSGQHGVMGSKLAAYCMGYISARREFDKSMSMI